MMGLRTSRPTMPPVTRNHELAAVLAKAISQVGARREDEIAEAIEGFLADDVILRLGADEITALADRKLSEAEIAQLLDRLVQHRRSLWLSLEALIVGWLEDGEDEGSEG